MKIQKTAGNKKMFWFFLPFVTALAVGLGITFAYVQNRMQLEQVQMEQIAIAKANKVNEVLTRLLYKTQVLSALVVQNDGEVREFDRTAATILDDPAVKNLILAPDGVVTYVYPLKDNENVVGLDYFSESEGNKEAIQARDTGELVLGGPFNLVQGGQGLVGRLPVCTADQKFWGIVSVTLNYPQALDGAELEQLGSQGFAYEIWRMSPDTGERQIISNSGYTYNHNARYVEYPMNILNASWYFRLSPIRAWYQFPETWILGFTCVFISILLGMLVLHNHDLNKMKQEFEKLSVLDPLTGILNRRGGFEAMKNRENKGAPFILCYMDLNGFKEINDRYGHHTGDRVLQEFAEALCRAADKRWDTVARIGGDEFILVLQSINGVGRMNQFFEDLKKRLENTQIRMDGKPLPISFSMGYACFPSDGTDIDELLVIADGRMYREKGTAR